MNNAFYGEIKKIVYHRQDVIKVNHHDNYNKIVEEITLIYVVPLSEDLLAIHEVRSTVTLDKFNDSVFAILKKSNYLCYLQYMIT